MRKFDVDVIVFDLDGTLIDSKLDIANALNWTLEKLGYPHLPVETIGAFVGNGVLPLIQRTLEAAGHLEKEEAMVSLFRQRYLDHLLDNTRLFDSVEETVNQLAGRYKLGLVSNKPERYTKKIVHELGIEPVFDGAVYGGDTIPVKKPDPQALLEIAEKYGSPVSRLLMVGDSAVDIKTGQNAGAYTVGVTYGFRPLKELADAGPDALIDRFSQLGTLLK